MKASKAILFLLFLFVSAGSALAQESSNGTSMLRRPQQKKPEPVEEHIDLFDETGVFLDEIEPGFFSRGWREVVVTGKPGETFVSQDGNLIHFDMPKKPETYAYAVNTADPISDMYVEAEFVIDDAYRLEYGVACRVSDAGWYEVRVQTTGDFSEMGSYKLYKYDPELKAKKGRNPYVLLHPNNDCYKTVDLKNGYGKRNVIGLSCVGDTIEVFINGVRQQPIKGLVWSDDQFSFGGFGFGAMTFNVNSAVLDVTYAACQTE